jgi:hypothetical protein
MKSLRRAARGAAGSGLGTAINYLRCTAGNSLGTKIKYLRRTTSGAAGNGLGTPINYLRGAAGSGLGTTIKRLRGTAIQRTGYHGQVPAAHNEWRRGQWPGRIGQVRALPVACRTTPPPGKTEITATCAYQPRLGVRSGLFEFNSQGVYNGRSKIDEVDASLL